MNNNNYLVSVVTPFHNTDMKLFEKGFKSLKRQTLGFDKIEWVVVIHNSEKHYLDEVRELTSGYENVKIYELNNDARTPSSPRNYALDHCTGKYVAFMDSDDSFDVTAMKEITEALESTGAQIASFRAEEETEDDTVLRVMDVRAMFDQTRSIIDLHKGDPELNKLIYAGGLTVWCKMIRRDVLEEHNIRFDLDLTYGEDVTFSMTCLKYAEHIIILPQVIGYVYYMHHGSLAQNVNLSPDGVMKVCKDFSRLFDVALEGGFAIERLAWPVMGYLANLMLFNPDMPEDYRTAICDKMRGYLDKMEDLPTDAKFFTPDMATGLMTLVRQVMLGENPDDADISIDENMIMTLLKENAGCELGIRYHFADIHSLNEYKKRVPLSEYSFYAPLVNLSTRIGESNLFTANRVVMYLSDFGSMQNPEIYPITEQDRVIYAGILSSQICGTTESTLLLMSALPHEKETHYKDDTYLDSVYGATVMHQRNRDMFTSYRRTYKYGCITSPEELVFPSSTYDLRYGRLLFALADPDVSQIIASNTWALLDLMNYLKQHWKLLVDDLRNGEISSETGLFEEVRLTLKSKLKKLPERADELQAVFEEGFDTPIIPRIWKKTERIIADAFGEYAFYTGKLRSYSGEIPISNGYLLLPEAVVAKATGPETEEMMFIQNNACIELLPKGSEGDTVMVKDAAENQLYEIIVTNRSGLYRKRTGVYVKAIARPDGSGATGFVYAGRKGDILRTRTLEFDTNELVPVIAEMVKKTGCDIADYSVSEADEGRIMLYLEAADDDTADKMKDTGKEVFSEILTDAIPGIPMEIRFVRPETQLLLRDRRRLEIRSVTDQMRPVRVLTHPGHKAMFDAFSF